MINTTEAVFVRERMAFVKQFLDEFDKAVDFALGLESTYKDLKAEIPGLKKERDGLLLAIEDLKAERTRASQENNERMGRMNLAAEKKSTDLNLKVSALETRLETAEKEHAKSTAEMEKQYRVRLSDLGKQVATEEAKLDGLKRAKEAAKAAVESL